jgi:hypothetical protein
MAIFAAAESMWTFEIRLSFLLPVLLPVLAMAQEPDTARTDNIRLDSLYIAEVEFAEGPVKVLHAEPLYIDLIRDLGARKGEKEWNLGFGMIDHLGHDVYEMLVEYEWAVADRLGLEIETPFRFYGASRNGRETPKPANRMESLKLAAQWTFLVSERASTSLALGYIHEFELPPFESFGTPLLTGHIYNPFFIAAKRWGHNFHTLIYTGPRIEYHLDTRHTHTPYELHTNFHYMIPGTRNFIGIEFNKSYIPGDFDMVIRPQMRVSLAENFLVGIVTGIPVERENQRFSMFTRLIWEPGHRH